MFTAGVISVTLVAVLIYQAVRSAPSSEEKKDERPTAKIYHPEDFAYRNVGDLTHGVAAPTGVDP